MVIYLSPHLDDAALSCGGLIWQQTQAGDDVEIWTLCAGDPPPGPLSPFAGACHDRWKLGETAVKVRREEDRAAAAVLGAKVRHWKIPDCIYRRSAESGEILYDSEEAIFGSVQPGDEDLVNWITSELAKMLPPGAMIICPMTLGNHVDHQITRAAAERLGIGLSYYADYPYAAVGDGGIEGLLPQGMKLETTPISERGIRAWYESIACYQSQISTFWLDSSAMKQEIEGYCRGAGGIRIWKNEQQMKAE